MTINYFRTVRNFGDVLSRPLVEALSGETVTAAVDLPNCDVMASGSIGWGGRLFNPSCAKGAAHNPLTFWGGGFLLPLSPDSRPKTVRPVKVCAVRGELSRADLVRAGLLGSEDDVTLGDAGLFYADLVPGVRDLPKICDVALVPHRLDWLSGERLANDMAAVGVSVRYVDPTGLNPFDCIRAIASARKVIASSLHALIVADALGIPNRRLKFDIYENDGAHRVEQSDFRFDDYYSAYGMKSPEPISECDLRRESQSIVESIGDGDAVAAEQVEACRNRLMASCPFRKVERISPVPPAREWVICSAIDHEVSLAASIVWSDLRRTILALRKQVDASSAKCKRLEAECGILRTARKAIEQILLEGNM